MWAFRRGGSCGPWPVSHYVKLIAFSNSEGILGILFCVYKAENSTNCHT